MSQELLNLSDETVSHLLNELWPALPSELTILNCKLVLTCGACPEQYDVFYNDTEIGYLRLRHGRFYAEYVPNNEIVYVDFPIGDGIFEEGEREEQLTKAIKALLTKHMGVSGITMVYLLSVELSNQTGMSTIVGVYSTKKLAEEIASKIKSHTSIREMVLDEVPKILCD